MGQRRVDVADAKVIADQGLVAGKDRADGAAVLAEGVVQIAATRLVTAAAGRRSAADVGLVQAVAQLVAGVPVAIAAIKIPAKGPAAGGP